MSTFAEGVVIGGFLTALIMIVFGIVVAMVMEFSDRWR